MSAPKPSLELLRGLSDGHVLAAFLDAPRLTRAEVATRTELSKPTVSQSVRRLVEAGLLRETGERTSGRGAVGTYYAVAADVAAALVVSLQPDGVVAEVVDPRGATLASATRPIERAAPTATVTELLTAVAAEATSAVVSPIVVAVVSAADPVDRRTGRLVELPDAAFLIGAVDPVAALTPFVTGPILVDNDVNWAAAAERTTTSEPLDDFAYLFLGEGLGVAVVADGAVRLGHHGVAGEISHLTVAGPDGRAMALTEVFASLGLHHPGSHAIDAERLVAETAGDGPDARQRLAVIAAAVGSVLDALVSLTDPEVVVIGGTWGLAPHVLAAIEAAADARVRPVPRRATTIRDQAPLAGARHHAVTTLRAHLLDRTPTSLPSEG